MFFASVISDSACTSSLAKLSANYLTSDVLSLTSSSDRSLSDLSPTHFLELMTMLEGNKIGSRVAKDLLPELFSSNTGPMSIAEERNLLQVSDTASLLPIIEEIITENESVVADYKAGKEVALKFLVGQGMKKTKGSADPTILSDLLVEHLKK